MNNEDRIWEQENIDQMYADEMQTQMDYEAQMAEQEMYESQMYADMQQESASYTQADVHDSDWHIADDMEEDAEDEDVVSDGSATAVSDAGNEQAELFMTVFPGVEMTKELAGLVTEVYVTQVTIAGSPDTGTLYTFYTVQSRSNSQSISGQHTLRYKIIQQCGLPAYIQIDRRIVL